MDSVYYPNKISFDGIEETAVKRPATNLASYVRCCETFKTYSLNFLQEG